MKIFGRQTVDKNKREIPQLLKINELRDLWVPRTGLLLYDNTKHEFNIAH